MLHTFAHPCIMTRIITISREYGSGGAAIAEILAKRLGWRLVDDPLIAEIATTAKISRETIDRYQESEDPWFHRIMKALWRGGQCLLQERQDAFHVYVYAPLAERMERLRHREPAGTNLALTAVQRDRQRAAYIRHYFGHEWSNPPHGLFRHRLRAGRRRD